METSEFSNNQPSFSDAELLPVSGSTCDCYRVKLYGKLHFMKRLKPELMTDPRYVLALQKEFETGYRLDHPHLVRYLSKGDDYLLTEYVDGETLKQFVISHPDYFKSRKNANRFLSQLLEVVGYLHQHQIVHLDLKPDNILITRIGYDVKLTDLGFCYSDIFADTTGRTDSFAAPEQMEGRTIDERADIYAIGRILETLPLPYIYNKVKNSCLQEDPLKRYQSAEEMLNYLPSEKLYNRWWLALIPVFALVLTLWFYDSSKTMVEDNIDNAVDSVMPSSSSKPDSLFDTIKTSAPEAKEKSQVNDHLMSDIKKAVEANFAIVLDAHKDSLCRSRNPFYSAGTYLKELNIISVQQLSAKYPKTDKEYIAKTIEQLTEERYNLFSEE